ncbi:response regulator [Deinococcus oregonensis]|uniref:Response regulator n=1 Tax=Deinococcus oregonensis TaxID=1805970 RepID=A0ABV6AVX7_9DEIO
MTPSVTHRIQRVLIVEDSTEDAWLLEWALQELAPEVHVQVIFDSFTALPVLQQPDPPDLLVLDLHLVHHTGLEVLEALNRQVGPSPRVVCWSSHAHPQEVAAVLEAGALAYVQKPPGVTGFLELAQTLLQG